jgi:hypothetical protein
MEALNLTGVGLGLFMLFAIGAGFLWVVKLEYYAGARVWKLVLAAGLLTCLGSLFLNNFWASALVGILGGSMVWGATELPEQEDRVRRGLFPARRRSEREEGQF